MNNFEFWDDMDKIFNAIVAYQEKTIEFNKRFINPWVNLGNVFDRQENNEEIVAHKNAIEIDPENAQNWYKLAGIYTRAGSFDKSIQAYRKALDLGFESGELYKNLALAHAMTDNHQDAIHLFEKSLDLLENDEDKAVVWNNIGNVHRKLNNYEMALQAFQQADQLDSEVSLEIREMEEETVTSEDIFNASQPDDDPASAIDDVTDSEETNVEDTTETDIPEANLEVEQAEAQQDEEDPDETAAEFSVEATNNADTEEHETEDDTDMPVILELDYSTDSTEKMQEETITDEIEYIDTDNEESQEEYLADFETDSGEVPTSADSLEEDIEPEEQETIEDSPTTTETSSKPSKIIAFLQRNANDDQDEIEDEDVYDEDEDLVSLDDETDNVAAETILPTAETSSTEEQLEKVAVEESGSFQEIDEVPVLSAYEEYLKDSNSPVKVDLTESELEVNQSIAMPPSEIGVTNSELNMDVNIDHPVDMDTKNAHVWNELGNVYFNAGSYDDAIAAYSKAIELDTVFAWPYTNLALSYVQKGHLDEAVLLYQRSIELFSNENDKAVTWNRLGNVYRRLNDYENAISAYQRADELDPGNIAITQQSRFSLLGSEEVNQEVGYSL